jgi:uncharacterized membrane protein HdeD (DUF308 family)
MVNIYHLTKADIEKYFIAEKHESLLFLIIGLVAIVLGLIFYFGVRTHMAKGAAVPFLLLGLIQAIVGYTVYQTSDDQRVNQVYAYDMNPAQLKTKELARMGKVNRHFILYRLIEIGGVLTGIVLILIFRNRPENHFWVGLGIALSVMGAELFIADFIAAKRALQYTQQLQHFSGSTESMHP